MALTRAMMPLLSMPRTVTTAFLTSFIGSYLHGIFDTGSFWRAIVNRVRREKGMDENIDDLMTIQEFRSREFDRLASIVRQNIDMDAIYRIIRGEDVPCGRWDND